MVMRGNPQANAAAREYLARCTISENDADRLYAALVALRGQATVDASPVGQAHLAAVSKRGD